MAEEDQAAMLIGTWQSTEAFGNTALDWSQAVKDQRVQLGLTFEHGGVYSFKLQTKEDTKDVTSSFRHVIPSQGTFTLQGEDGIVIDGDTFAIKWTYLFEDEDSLRIRLEGAKRFGRCKGVDVIYFDRVKAAK